MKILFSPSESKKAGGEGEFSLNSLIFSELSFRQNAYERYLNFVKTADEAQILKLFGLKRCYDLRRVDKSALKAVLRYDGVAYKALKYELLDDASQKYIDENVLIFSNLFGVLRARDRIPFYKLKQGEKIGEFDTGAYYGLNLAHGLEKYLQDEPILDLRAGFYDRFFAPKGEVLTLKFYKNGKIISHLAKFYRGEILRVCAQEKVSEFDEFFALKIPNLQVKNVIKKQNQTCVNFDIC